MTLTPPQKIRLLGASSLFVLTVIFVQWLQLKPYLQFDRSLIEQGEFWRILTGNLIHYNFEHLWMNLAGLALGMYLLAFRYSLIYWFIMVIFCSIAVGVGLYFFDINMRYYVGLSGALHGILVAGAITEYFYNKTTSVLLLLFIVCKLAYEQFIGPLSAPLSSGTSVAINAHLYGAISGVLIGAVLVKVQTKK
jgi:rhomboid family GlyGly-CTERM serine protease